MIGLRTFSFIVGLTVFLEQDMELNYGYTLAFAIISFAVPQLLYLPGHIRPIGFIAAEIFLSGGYAVYLTTTIPQATSAFYIPLFVICFLSSLRMLYAIVPICMGLLPILWGLTGGLDTETVVNVVLNMGLFAAFGFGFGVFLRQKEQLSGMLETIEDKNRALKHAIQQVERSTLLEERNRMSRELHDTVGHSLTASIVAMEAVHTLIDRDSQMAKDRLQQLIGFSRGHLDQFRQTVHNMALNELKLPLDELLRQTADSYAAQTRTVVSFETEGAADGYIADALKLSLLRCMQESLTNATRHGEATEVRVWLRQGEGRLLLRIQDNGRGASKLEDGFGIEGMRERIEALRGSFRIAAQAGTGTTVICEIPMGV